MRPATWTRWPAWEPGEMRTIGGLPGTAGLAAAGGGRQYRLALRALVPVSIVYAIFSEHHISGWLAGVVQAAAVVAAGWLMWVFNRSTRQHRLVPSLISGGLLLVAAAFGQWQGFSVAVAMLTFGCALVAIQRMPLAAGVPVAAVALGGYTIANHQTWISSVVTLVGMGLAGCVMRLDAGSRHRLKVQERAARAAEAESAALGERARIARDIHDVLAHSLSAQLVHLEAARLRIEQEEPGPFRDQILERVVAARSMARDGLAETRQALSALRGEMAPLGDYLREVAASDGAEVDVAGTPRPVPTEASQTVRRVVQEALTNVRKHAPGARVHIDLTYGPDELALCVRDSGGGGAAPRELASSGSGYGLLGMRERAELLGGTLEAGPVGDGGKGYSVRLRVPA
ncbi:sensor histidine kinase [Streptomyces montanisoli]|nr:histidine kinase [Streptomyces montanisoli]